MGGMCFALKPINFVMEHAGFYYFYNWGEIKFMIKKNNNFKMWYTYQLKRESLTGYA